MLNNPNELMGEAESLIDRVESLHQNNQELEELQQLFRILHSLKGIAGFIQHQELELFCHNTEALIEIIRDNPLLCGDELEDLLAESCLFFGKVLHEPNTSTIAGYTNFSKRLQSIVSSYRVENEDIDCEMVIADEAVDDILFAVETASIRRAKLSHHLYFQLQCDWSLMEEMGLYSSPTHFVDDLQRGGDILDTKLTIPEWDLRLGAIADHLSYRFFYATGMDRKTISVFTGLPLACIQPIEIESSVVVNSTALGGTAHVRRISARIQNLGQQSSSSEDTDVTLSFPHMQELPYACIHDIVGQSADLAARLSERSSTLETTAVSLQESVSRLSTCSMEFAGERLEELCVRLGNDLGRDIQFLMNNKSFMIDAFIMSNMMDVFIHLMRNACDHGIESPYDRDQVGKDCLGTVRLEVQSIGQQVTMVFSDNGRGIDVAALREKVVDKGLLTATEVKDMDDSAMMQVIFRPGFSTADKVSYISGRGMGMDIVKSTVERLGGMIVVESELGLGTKFHISLPVRPAESLIEELNRNQSS